METGLETKMLLQGMLLASVIGAMALLGLDFDSRRAF